MSDAYNKLTMYAEFPDGEVKLTPGEAVEVMTWFEENAIYRQQVRDKVAQVVELEADLARLRDKADALADAVEKYRECSLVQKGEFCGQCRDGLVEAALSAYQEENDAEPNV